LHFFLAFLNSNLTLNVISRFVNKTDIVNQIKHATGFQLIVENNWTVAGQQHKITLNRAISLVILISEYLVHSAMVLCPQKQQMMIKRC